MIDPSPAESMYANAAHVDNQRLRRVGVRKILEGKQRRDGQHASQNHHALAGASSVASLNLQLICCHVKPEL